MISQSVNNVWEIQFLYPDKLHAQNAHMVTNQIHHILNAHLASLDISIFHFQAVDASHVLLEHIRVQTQAQAAPHAQQEQLPDQVKLFAQIAQLGFHVVEEVNYHVYPHLIHQKDLQFA
jgi:hypothetical protein